MPRVVLLCFSFPLKKDPSQDGGWGVKRGMLEGEKLTCHPILLKINRGQNCKALALLLLAVSLNQLALPSVRVISIQIDSVPNRKERLDYIMLHYERYRCYCTCIWNFLSLKDKTSCEVSMVLCILISS